MQFLIIVIHVALMALTAWWIWRSWHKEPTLSQPLDTAGVKSAAGLMADYIVPSFFLPSFGPLAKDDFALIVKGVLVFVVVSFLLIVGVGDHLAENWR
jgi:hypothetical protein